ncbi:MAG: MFS transporter [Deltaproteobacteria bacterium]|nr:MFS transporter [Deltaproteobacteria bacterium]
MSTAEHDQRRMRWGLITLASMYVGYAAFLLCRNTLVASSAALIADPALDIDKVAYGRLMSYATIGAVLGKLTVGMFADRLGGRIMFIVSLAVTALSSVAFGWVSIFFMMGVLNFSGQFFKAGGWPAMAKIVGNWYPPNKHGRIWAVISTSSRVGTFLAGLLVGWLLLENSWRTAFSVTGAITATIVFGLWFVLKNKPADVGLEPPETTRPVLPGEAALTTNHPLTGTTLAQACGHFVRSPRVWLICLAISFLTILMDFMVFIPIYLAESFNLGAGEAGIAGSTFPLGMLIALIASGIFYDQFSKSQLTYVLGGLLVVACGCAMVLWLLPSLPLPASARSTTAVATLFVLGFAISPAYYLPMSIFSIAHGGAHSGFLIATIDVFGYLAAWPFTFFGGQIAQDYGWGALLGGLLAVSMLALGTMTTFLRLDATASAGSPAAQNVIQTPL